MFWTLSHRADRRAVLLADRHYSRQKPGTKQFVAPGRCLVLLTERGDALWVSSWPYPEFTKHDWPGAWICTLFRNESTILSSTLIQSAVAATRWRWGKPPKSGMVTFININKVRTKPDPGWCFLRAGWKPAGYTKQGLLVLQLLPVAMPAPHIPHRAQPRLL